jgi:hypothetical protein
VRLKRLFKILQGLVLLHCATEVVELQTKSLTEMVAVNYTFALRHVS